MKPISELDASKIKGIFFDIDDTFSSNGKIRINAFEALWKLYESGFACVPITGRPSGWCDHIARMWPVTAVIGENGAFYFMLKDNKLVKKYLQSKEEIEMNKTKFKKIIDEVKKLNPLAVPSSDQMYREFDLSIDFCEDVPHFSEEMIDDIVKIFEKHGAVTKVSSIHVNGWFGNYDKLSAAKTFAKNELDIDLEKDNSMFVFAGDSQNDEPIFKFFDNSVGVNNVLEFEKRLKHFPKFITKGKSGDGFAELTERLLIGRK